MKQHGQASLPVWTAFVTAHNVTERLEYVHLHGQFTDIARKTFYQEGWWQCCYFGIKTKLNDVALPPPEIKPESLRFASTLDIGCSILQSMGTPFLSLPGLVSHSSSSRAQLCVSEKFICPFDTWCSLKARTAEAWDGASGISDGSGGISLWVDRLQTPVWQAVCTLSCTGSIVTFPATLFEKEFPNCWLLMGEGLYFLLFMDLENYWRIWMQLHIQRTTTALQIPGISGFFFSPQTNLGSSHS